MRRWWIALVCFAALAGCDSDDEGGDYCVYQGQVYPIGASWPAGDGCNTCYCDESGWSCTLIACEGPDAGVSCAASEGCAVGPRCGDVCCDTGEACVGGECRCGDGPACGSGDTCEAAGPIGGDACGQICCGVSGPCPQ
jgi:hypothetical protein